MLSTELTRSKAFWMTLCLLVLGGGMLSTVDSDHFSMMRRILSNKKTGGSGGGTTSPPTTPAYPEATMIPSNFDVSTELQLSWGSGAIAPVNGTDANGVFRYTCDAGQLKPDDPVLYPAQPTASSPNQFFGNTMADGSSTYSTLRQYGDSTCQSRVDRSAYWVPAMYDGTGNIVRPDYVTMEYRRRPATDTKCQPSVDSYAVGICIPLPNGLRYEIGYDMLGSATTLSPAVRFTCSGPTAISGEHNMAGAVANCPTAPAGGTYNRLGAIVYSPQCWDGKNLDSPDHRSHVAYTSTGWLGYEQCPSTHPFYIPSFKMTVWYTVDANLQKWHFASDEARPGVAAGTTFHAGWFGGWDNQVMSTWVQNCINKRLNCSGGDLGNGKQMKTYAGFTYNANPRLVPAPTAPAPSPAPTPTPPSTSGGVLDEGDSISVFWAGNHTGIYAAAHPTVSYNGKAVGGSTIATMNSRFAVDSALRPRLVTVLIGANDLTSYATTNDWLNALWAYTAQWKALGAKVVVGTVLPQCNNAAHNARRVAANAAIRAAVGNQFDAVADYAADPVMGPDAAACNTSLYKDGLHPTDYQTPDDGQHKIEAIYARTVDAVLGI